MDFRQTFALNDGQRIFCKRASLSHEREVRATLQNDREAAVAGRIVACDLEALVDAVIVAPFAPAWFLTTVSEVIARFGYRMKVHRSALLEEPFF